MKISLKKGILIQSGQLDGMIYYFNPRIGQYIGRRAPHNYKTGENHIRFAKRASNISKINPSAAYIADCKAYLALRNKQGKDRNLGNWYLLFTRIMWELARQDPSIDLESLEKATIYALDLPCINIRRAVEAGLLAKVEGYRSLTASL